MSGEFLKRALELRARDEMPAEDHVNLDHSDGGMPELLFSVEDELLLVVEAAELWAEKGGYRTDEDGLLVSLSLRLHVLDEKVRKL